MATHTKGARKSTWNKHTQKSTPVQRQEKVNSGRFTQGGSPKGRRHRKQDD